MSEEKKTEQQNAGGSTENQIDRAAYEAALAKAAKYDELSKNAQEAEFDSIEDYQATLEDVAEKYVKMLNDEKAKGSNESNGSEAKTAPKTPQKNETAVDPQLINQMKVNQQQSSQAFIAAQWSEFRLAQSEKPEEERADVQKKDLMKLISNPTTANAIALLSQKEEFDGNIFAAAAFWHDLNHGKKTAAEKATKAAEAKANAAATANLGTGGATKEASNLTPEQQIAERQKQEREAIAPPRKYVYPG